MNNLIIILRHAETQLETTQVPSCWKLSSRGVQQSMELILKEEHKEIDIFISSSERKAIETITPLAEQYNKNIIFHSEFCEINRDNGEILSPKVYEIVMKKVFEDMNVQINNWETGNDALVRFKKGIKAIDKKYNNSTILISTHQTVMSLYLAFLKNDFKNIHGDYKRIKYCSSYVVKNNNLIRDIE